MPLVRTAGPAGPAVPLPELMEYLRVSDDADALMVAGVLASATDWVEQWTQRALITQNWRLELDHWPSCGVVEIQRVPVAEILSISYLDQAGTLQTLTAGDFRLAGNGAPARLVPAVGRRWPATIAQPGTISIEFRAGYGESWNAVPATLRIALMRLAAQFYENREVIAVGGSATELPFGLETLLAPYRVGSLV